MCDLGSRELTWVKKGRNIEKMEHSNKRKAACWEKGYQKKNTVWEVRRWASPEELNSASLMFFEGQLLWSWSPCARGCSPSGWALPMLMTWLPPFHSYIDTTTNGTRTDSSRFSFTERSQQISPLISAKSHVCSCLLLLHQSLMSRMRFPRLAYVVLSRV